MKRPRHLTPAEAEIARLLDKQRMYGLELVSASNGKLSMRAIYVQLGRMVRRGYVVACKSFPAPPGESGMPRTPYRLTALGKRSLYAHEVWLQAFDRGPPPRSYTDELLEALAKKPTPTVDADVKLSPGFVASLLESDG